MKRLSIALLTALVFAAPAAAQYAVAKLEEAPPADLADAVKNSLEATGYRVTSGTKTICDFWLAKEWSAREDFKPSATIIYPLVPGELIGAIRFPRKSEDFRGQEIPRGAYTLRYAWQVEDGNHIGTSDTRDFLLAVPAEMDQTADKLDIKELFKKSAATNFTNHPAILSMLRPNVGQADKLPAALHDDERDLVSVRVQGKAKAGEKPMELKIQFVVQGKGEA